ncbi:hypothetical protein HDV00_000047 [Rhizophlyctis rosea]|nr:hypothetical protein HDV00_000047 [Rhizophlyctis rosea]
MVYLLGVNLPDHKVVPIALTEIYGVGRKTASDICNKLRIHPKCRLAHLPETKLTEVATLLNTMKIEAELRREVNNNIEHLVRIGTWRGDRHKYGRPVNGQRTRPNGKTAKRLNGRTLPASLRRYTTR